MINLTLEVCVDTAAGLQAAVEGQADRVELCSALELGGLTPSIGLMQLAHNSTVPVYAMIRPRAGDFCFTDAEINVMADDIRAASDAGLAGVVLGAANADNTLNTQALATLCELAGPMGKTLHRVIDTLQDAHLALEQAIDLGFDQVLTSGGQPDAIDGVDMLAQLQVRAAGRIAIMAGSGVTPARVAQLHRQTGIVDFHASCRVPVPLNHRFSQLGFGSAIEQRTDVDMIRQFRLQLDGLTDNPSD